MVVVDSTRTTPDPRLPLRDAAHVGTRVSDKFADTASSSGRSYRGFPRILQQRYVFLSPPSIRIPPGLRSSIYDRSLSHCNDRNESREIHFGDLDRIFEKSTSAYLSAVEIKGALARILAREILRRKERKSAFKMMYECV